MPLDDRDYVRGNHPPSCSCKECCTKRLGKDIPKEGRHRLTVCPKCGQKSLWHNIIEDKYECLNLKCNAKGRSLDEIAQGSEDKLSSSQNLESDSTLIRDSGIVNVSEQGTPKPLGVAGHDQRRNNTSARIQYWLIALILICGLLFVGFGLNVFLDTFVPFLILSGFGVVYSLEKWFRYQLRIHKLLGRLYRLFLNLSILSLLGLLIWSAIRLFSQQLANGPLAGSLVFLAEFTVFVWLWRIVSKNSWRRPSMKLTIFSLMCVFAVFAYAGVEPMTAYKDRSVTYLGSTLSTWARSITDNRGKTPILRPTTAQTQTPTPSTTPTPSSKPSATTSPKPAATEVTTKGIDLPQLEKQIHDLTNVERVKNGLSPLNWDTTLNKIAQKHSQDMALRNYFSHTSPGGYDLSYRYQRGGFPVRGGAAENIFQCTLVKSQWYLNGIPTYAERYSQSEIASLTVESWMQSPGHRQNIVTPQWSSEGIGIAISSDGKVYVTQDFG